MNEELESKVEGSETDTARLRRLLNGPYDLRQALRSLAGGLSDILSPINGYAEIASSHPEDIPAFCGIIQEQTRRASALIEAYKKISNSDNFKSIVSHNFNNAFTAIQGLAERGQTHPQDFSRYKSNMMHSINMLIKFIDEMYRFANASVLGQKKAVDVADVAEAALAAVNPQETYLTEVYAAEQKFVLAGKQDLIYAYKSLLKNSIEAGAKKIDVSVYQKDSTVCTSIRDNGKGMDEENLKKIFEPFFTTQDTVGHLGLGLATSKRIIEKYGGKILVESHIREGSVFTVELPEYKQNL